MMKKKTSWKDIFNVPWRMDNWIFWILLALMSVLLVAMIYLGIEYTKIIIERP
jgi:hypothetical protein